jgi:hypothetical protein
MALLAGLALSVGFVAKVPAATTWTVCASGCNYSSIKAAIAASTTLNGDTLAIAAGTYTEAGISVDKSLTLQGEDAATTIVQAATTKGTAPDRVFLIPSSVTVTLQDLMIQHGSSTEGGGLYNFAFYYNGYAIEGHGGLISSIVANNPQGADCFTFIGSSILSGGYNLDSDGSCQLTAPTDRPGVDPLLGPLQNNGGPTATQALLPGSPALDAIPWGTNGCGTTLVSDQRWQARPHAVGASCDIGAYEEAVAGQPLSGWVTGLTPSTVSCQNVTTGQAVTMNDHATSWDCEAAGLGVSAGNQVSMRVQGAVAKSATDVGGAVTGMAPSSGGCTNLTTGQQVKFQHMAGATAASCVAAGLVVHAGDTVQISAQGGAE